MSGSFLGPEYTDEQIERALREHGIAAQPLERRAFVSRVAQRIADGAVVGFFQGRAEFGPRALGNRSILADARAPEMQRVLNLKIKQRESFRPFAPIVLAERAAEYFEFEGESPYMLFTAPLRAERRLAGPNESGGLLEQVNRRRSDIPAVTHVDYSARIQTVDAARNPGLHELLVEFDRLTGCPVMINTSFNVRGEPPVCQPREAIEGFLATEMDTLAIGSFIVEKSELPPSVMRAVQPRTFAPD